MLEQIVASFLATCGFGLLFGLEKTRLFFSSLNGVLSWCIYLLLIRANLSETLSFFLSSVAMTIYSEIMARKIKAPATLFLIGGFIPLVPGSGVYYTMYGVITSDTVLIVKKGIQTLSIAGAITIGIFFGITLDNMFLKIKENNQRDERENRKDRL